MRTLIATRAFAPEPAAAAWRQAALATALAEAGHEVEVLTTRLPAGTTEPAVPPARAVPTAGAPRVSRWPVLRDASGNVRGYLQYASYDLPLGLRLARRLLGGAVRRGSGPDVVVVEPPPTTGAVVRLVCAAARVPYVYYAADLLSLAAREAGLAAPALRLLTALESWVLRGAACVLTVDEGYAARVRDLGVRPERVEVVGTGVNTDVLRPVPAAAGATRDAPADAPELVYAGTMSEVQGAGVFLEALAGVLPEHPRARAVFYGGGVEATALAARALALGLDRVEFRGLAPLEEIARVTSAARAGLASQKPDTAYSFAFLVKPLAATACGAPVVYAGAGPFADLVDEHRLGWAVGWDPEQVAGALRKALAGEGPSVAERERLATWTRERYSLRAVAARAAAATRAAATRSPRSPRS